MKRLIGLRFAPIRADNAALDADDRPSFGFVLEAWLRGQQPKTLGTLTALAAEKSFAVLVLLLMFVPALPLPTGGATHVFEIIAMLVALEMVAGRRTVWLPQRWAGVSLVGLAQRQGAHRIVSAVRWAERFARPRLAEWMQRQAVVTAIGIEVLGFTLVAFLAPPFSGLDTLPALGVVVLALGLIFEDALLWLFGTIIGAAGVGLMIALGTLVYG